MLLNVSVLSGSNIDVSNKLIETQWKELSWGFRQAYYNNFMLTKSRHFLVPFAHVPLKNTQSAFINRLTVQYMYSFHVYLHQIYTAAFLMRRLIPCQTFCA